MTFSWPRGLKYVLALGLSAAIGCPQHLIAQDHVVSSADIQRDLQAASATRQKQLAEVMALLGSREARRALASAHIEYRQVQKAVQSLSDQDLARLAARAERAQKDFAAGNLSDRDLILIILAVAVLVLIIVAVR